MSDKQRDLFSAEPAPWELDDRDHQLVAAVILAEGLDRELEYLIPAGMRLKIAAGRRLRVPLGKGNRSVVGYCIDIRDSASVASHRLKEVYSVVDDVTLLSPSMLQLTKWLSDYYLCTWGQAIEAAIPAGVRVQAGTREAVFLSVLPHVVMQLDEMKLGRQQRAALELLATSKTGLTPQQLAEAVGCSEGPIQQLRKRKLVVESTKRVVVSGQRDLEAELSSNLILNKHQQQALDQITGALADGSASTILLMGVTGSGKTEVYIRAIEEVLRYGKQAIVLVPEISLTPQTQERFRSRFPHVAVLHSLQSDAERHWHWRRIANGEVQVIVGARSAVFAPTPRLGLIVIDEEHDASFKQDTVPRYHARTVAQQRCEMERAPLVLGSATPSLESYHLALSGQYKLAELPQRVEQRPLPPVQVLDLRPEYRSRIYRGAISRPLHQAIDQAVRDGGQVILLLNRRGYSTTIQCPACGHVVNCPHCDISLTHHREGETATCHYCDFHIRTPAACPNCQFAGIRFGGLGTQKLEAEVKARFRNVPCLRMDSDSMKKPGAHQKALDSFRRGEIKILLGTQMIAKGLDFPAVTLVGVINADTALHLPNFRSSERTFQLVTQVSGRTGRGERGGRVVVQTFSPDHPAIQAASKHDYVGFASNELPHRERFQYPPFGEMLRVIVRGENGELVSSFIHAFAAEIGSQLAGHEARMIGPAPTPIAKLRGKHRFHLLLIGNNGAALRSAVRAAGSQLTPPADIQWAADVDPLDML